MNPLLNGTGWGEISGRELKIPYFMTSEWKETERKIEEAEAARVYIPDLTPEERQRRMKQIHKAAAELIMSLERKKKNEVGQSV